MSYTLGSTVFGHDTVEEIFVEFPEKIKFDKQPSVEFFNSENNVKVTCLQKPPENIKSICAEQIMCTWSENSESNTQFTEEEKQKIFEELLSFKVLPNSMEAFNFTFKFEGMTLIEATHLLRHRLAKSIHWQCTADRFLTDDSVFIPSSIENSEFADEYKELTIKTKDFYQKMVNSRKISIMDARYILNRNNRYFCFMTFNIKEIIEFINQRKCTQVQPEIDNIIAKQMYDIVCETIPEFKKILSLKCGPNCHYLHVNPKRNTRLYKLDKIHEKFASEDLKKTNTVYGKTRAEMGVKYLPED